MSGARFDRLLARDLAPLLRSLLPACARARVSLGARLAPSSLALCWLVFAIASSGALPAVVYAEAPTGEPVGSESQSETAPNTPSSPPSVTEIEMLPRATRRARETSLVAILAARGQIESDLRALQTELISDSARGRENELERQIQARVADLTGLSRSFSELATGVDPLSLDTDPEPRPFELAREVRQLLSPLINELKRATSRPREIDRLRTEIADLDIQLKTIDKALEQLEVVRQAAKLPELVNALASERKDWARRRSAIEATLEVTQQKLDQRDAESRSLSESVQEIFQGFFKSRGRNLLIAFLAMAGFLFALRRLRAFLARRPQFAERESTFGGRVFSLAYSVFTVVGAMLVFVIALYLFGDWVLLILALLLILGLFWASKQALPRFWSQAVLILDMGAVREGQRVWMNGLPWRIESIAFYCVLVNPALVGGQIRIPLEDIALLRSRPDRADETWFPTREGDVVLLDEGRPAVVEFQSTEVVRLRSPGGNQIIVPTSQFIAQSHEILSNGYRVDVLFGIDHQHQTEITTSTREAFETEVERRWRETEWARSLVGVAVEFSAAGLSSLDYFVRVDLDGSQATDYAAQRRYLTSLCVDVCNQNGWLIPFAQMNVHMAPPNAP